MNQTEFEAQLRTDRYDEIVTVEKPAGYLMAEHHHPFDACALITAGDFHITVNGLETTYHTGDIFSLPAGTPHLERAGAAGATYLAGRKRVVLP